MALSRRPVHAACGYVRLVGRGGRGEVPCNGAGWYGVPGGPDDPGTVLRTFVVHDDMMRCGICSDVVCVRLRVTRAATLSRLYKKHAFALVYGDGAVGLRNSLRLISGREIDHPGRVQAGPGWIWWHIVTLWPCRAAGHAFCDAYSRK